MRITIFSLGGLLGQYVTNTALLHGAQVTAYVPDAKVIWPRKNLTVIEGSLQNRERVLEALLEADAVISVLTPMRVKHVKEEETPLADGNAMILSAMKQLGKTRFVTVGHVCIHAFGDCEDKYQRMSTKFMQIFWPGVYKDMQKMGQVLARSDLNWTLVRTCPGRDGKVKKVGQNCSISLDGSQFRPGYSREALAEFLYEAAADQQMYSRKMPIFLQRGVRMDFSILYVLQHLHNAVLDRVMVGITSLGNAGWIWIALTAVFLILPKYRKCGVRMAIALILDLILCNLVLKPLAARPRPCWIDEQVKLLVAAPKDYSFPSGHSAASFAAAVSIFVMHKKEGAAALILACLIAFSRLYLFVHFPTDVLAGIAVGFICAFLAAKIQNGFLLHSRGR